MVVMVCRYVVKCNSARRWLFRVILFFPHPQQDPLPTDGEASYCWPGGGGEKRASCFWGGEGYGEEEMTADSSTAEFDWPRQDAWRQEALDRKPPTAAGRVRVRGEGN